MNCVRCEIARARLWAILYANTGRTHYELRTKLNDTLPGFYYILHFGNDAGLYRQNDNPEAPAISIWRFDY